jgi:cytochrome c553
MEHGQNLVLPRGRPRASRARTSTYLLRLLRGFKARTASDLDGTMTVASQPLTPEDIVSLVHFLASLGPDPTSR